MFSKRLHIIYNYSTLSKNAHYKVWDTTIITKKKLSILLFITVSIAVIVFFLVEHHKKSDLSKNHRSLVLLLKSAKKLNHIWKNGDINLIKVSKCPWAEKRLVGRSNYRCSPEYLKCFANGSKFTVENKLIKISFPIGSELITKSKYSGKLIPNKGIAINLSVAKLSLPIILKDSCSEVFLPQKKYAYGSYMKNRKDWIWDNFKKNIFIDKSKVSIADIARWQKSKKDVKKYSDDKDAIGLTYKQMGQYCASIGKQIVSAHIFDAFSFYPSSEVNNIIIRGRYPWGAGNRRDEFYKLWKNKDYKFSKKLCTKIPTRECFENHTSYRKSSASWVGVFQLLGGTMEAVRNSIDPKKNLIPSSYHFNAHSYWHQLGQRVFWDGNGFLMNNIIWRREMPEVSERGPFDIGFRCMRMIDENL